MRFSQPSLLPPPPKRNAGGKLNVSIASEGTAAVPSVFACFTLFYSLTQPGSKNSLVVKIGDRGSQSLGSVSIPVLFSLPHTFPFPWADMCRHGDPCFSDT